MSINRRTAITTLAAAGAGVLLPKGAHARPHKVAGPDAIGMLYDPVRCIGCRECVRACAEVNGKDATAATAAGAQLSTRSLTVLQQHENGGTESFLKVQCMHCVDPACASACMLGAMQKQPDGAVTWDGDLCVGCRYCQIACPFNVPRFEWETPLPELTKCQLCPDRRAEGQLPACADTCKMGAIMYGSRADLLAEAHRRIADKPEKYAETVYGEHEGGGTTWLYLAKKDVTFQAMGLPALAPESVPSMPETIQHTLYKGFAAPLALLGVFGVTVRRNSKLIHEEEAKAHEHHHSEPVGGKIFTIPFTILAILAAIGFAGIGWRFLSGLGATTNLNDGFPMGLWIAFDVVTGTALACGGYAVAILVYLLNRGKYHPLIRAAIVTSALGYSLGGLSVLIDIGRAWNFYKIPLFFTHWNFNSILLEVALCIMCYTMVLWIELSPAILEGWKEARMPALRRFAVAALPKIEKAMPYVIALGLLLPTMHQSSLGSLMLLSGAKLHPIWRTPLLPLLFLVSCIGMGYAAVVLEATISSKVFKRPSEVPMLRALGGPISFVLMFYAVLRAIDVWQRGQVPAIFAGDHYALLFHVEMTLLTVPAFVLMFFRRRANAPLLATIGAMVILGGALYRFSTYLIAFNPGAQWSYFPSIPEFAVTIGLVAAELMGYIFLVKRFPILRGAPSHPHHDEHAAEPAPAPAPAPAPVIPVGSAVVGAMIALALLAAPVALQAQSAHPRPGSAPAVTRAAGKLQKAPDRKCLTVKQCLTEEVPTSEPHEAVCATCHNLSRQRDTKEAAKTCASAGCHERADTLTPFHRGLHKDAQQNCIGCHPAHNAKIAAGGDDCQVCHDAGGQLPSEHLAKNVATRTIRPGLVFRHTEHGKVECRSCHDTKAREHATPMAGRIEQCRSCHHKAPVANNCLSCHDKGEIQKISTKVTRTMNIKVGKLNNPTRVLPFEHSRHVDNAQCRSCHNTGLQLSAKTADCNGCHTEHKKPTSNCTTCHETPAPGAHTKNAHLGCGGVGCHENASATVLSVPRTRQACLACHEDMVDHKPAADCADCHKLPKPRTVKKQ